MAKKKNIRLIGIIIFFLVPFLMGIAIGLFIGFRVFTKVPDNSNENNNTNKIVLLDNTTRDELFKVVNNDNLEKVIYNYRAKGTELDNMTNDEKLYLAGIDSYYKTSGTWVTFDVLKDSLVKKYGSDYNVQMKDYNYHNITTIKVEDGNYTYSGDGFNYLDNATFIDLYTALELKQDNDLYYLTVDGIYHQQLKNEETYSNDKGFVFNEAVSSKTSLTELYKTNQEQFMRYVFIFKKVNDKYILTKFQKAN